MDDPTLLIHWLFSCLTLIIIAVRVIWGRVSRKEFLLGDYLSMGAALCAITRIALIHIVLTWGTNNVAAAYRKGHIFDAHEIHRREIGSKLAVANRVFYNSYLWLQKLVLLDVYRRLIKDVRWEKPTLLTILVVFFGTYVAVQVTTFSECNPFHLYWQVVPDPGSCAKAQLQLIVVGVLNIVTDFMLLLVPLPVVFKMQVNWRRKVQLLLLFGLGVFVIAITLIRLPINAFNSDSQVNRTTWASTELLTAAMVVNAPTLYGLWNKRRQETQANSHGKAGSSYMGYNVSGGSRNAERIATTTIGGGPLDVEPAIAPSYPMKPVSKSTKDRFKAKDGLDGTEDAGITEFRGRQHNKGAGEAADSSSHLDEADRASSKSSQQGFLKR